MPDPAPRLHRLDVDRPARADALPGRRGSDGSAATTPYSRLTIPYLAHLLSVAALVAEDGGGEVEVMGALLHDAAEDRGGEERLADIRRRFGPDVEALVRGLSDALVPEGEEKPPWRPRKEEYLEHLRAGRHSGVLRISNADKLHNARAILADYRQLGEKLWSRFNAPVEDQLWYYGELASIFSERRAGSPLAQELASTVAQLRAEVEAGRSRPAPP